MTLTWHMTAVLSVVTSCWRVRDSFITAASHKRSVTIMWCVTFYYLHVYKWGRVEVGAGGAPVFLTKEKPDTAMISPECFFPSRLFGVVAVTSGSYLMQLSGSRRQSVLHMNLSQCNQPMVGFSARPLSSASAAGPINAARPRTNTPCNIADRKLAHSLTTVLNINVWLYFLVMRFHPAHPGRPTPPRANQMQARL